MKKFIEKIHKGQYDSTSHKDLVDIRLVKPESMLKSLTEPIQIQNETQNTKKLSIINEERKLTITQNFKITT